MTSTYSHSQIHLVAQCTFRQSTLKMNVIRLCHLLYSLCHQVQQGHLAKTIEPSHLTSEKKLTKVPSGLETATCQGWWIAALKHF